MPKQGYQWRRSEGCIMELVPSGSGAQAPDQIKKEKESSKLQAPSSKRHKKNTIE